MWINSTDDLINGVLNHGPDILTVAIRDAENPDISQYINRVNNEHLKYPIPPTAISDLEWFIPYKYKNIDIHAHLLGLCSTDQERLRVETEYALYEQFNMTIILNVMLYLVDLFKDNGIIWGVGRGSSVASYCLYLLEVHNINSLEYELDVNEFFH